MATKAQTIEKTKAQANSVMKRRFTGVVVSAPKQKTVSVLVERIKIHPKYRKQYTVTQKYAVHDEKNEAVVGQVVHFEECRPISKTKRWRIVK